MIEDSIKQFAQNLQSAFSEAKQGLPSNEQIREVFEAQLPKLNLVTREEFDTQKLVLERTRAKIEELEKKLAEFEKN